MKFALAAIFTESFRPDSSVGPEVVTSPKVLIASLKPTLTEFWLLKGSSPTRRVTKSYGPSSIMVATMMMKNTELAALGTTRNSTRQATNTSIDNAWSTRDADDV